MTDRGTYIQHAGRPAVRFERAYAHPVDRVWRAITEPDELGHWFPSQVEHEGRVGGAVRLSGDPNKDGDTGTILTWDPPHRFGFQWGGDELHFTIAATDEGCRLELIDVLDGDNTAARNAAGWYVCLIELAYLIDEEPRGGPHAATAEPFWPVYEAHVADGLPSGAEIPGVDAP